jgi:excisionase family DNA binding protein
MTESNMNKILVSKKEGAAALGISLRTIENLIAHKELETRRIGRRRLIVRTSLERLARRDVPSLNVAVSHLREDETPNHGS